MGYQNGNRPEGIDQAIVDAMADLSALKNDVLTGKLGPEAIAASIAFISGSMSAIADAHKELEKRRGYAIEQPHSLANEDVHRQHGCDYAPIDYTDLDEVVDVLAGKDKEKILKGPLYAVKPVKDYSRFKPLLAQRESCTDDWGEDLLGNLTYIDNYEYTSKDLLPLLEEYKKLSAEERRECAEALYPDQVGKGYGYED